eukprot:scaffold32350_cov112-Isochrysis_galbana.AAC.1
MRADVPEMSPSAICRPALRTSGWTSLDAADALREASRSYWAKWAKSATCLAVSAAGAGCFFGTVLEPLASSEVPALLLFPPPDGSPLPDPPTVLL